MERWLPVHSVPAIGRALSQVALLPFLFFDFAGDVAAEGALTTYDWWRRNPDVDAPFGLDPFLMNDLGMQVVMWWAPNGLQLSGMRLVLARNHLTSAPAVVAHQLLSDWYPYAWHQPRLEQMTRALAAQHLHVQSWIDPRPLMADGQALAYPFHRVHEPLPFPPPARGASQWHEHPHEHLRSEWHGAYQPLRSVPAGPVVLQPGVDAALAAALGGELTQRLRYEIEEDPRQLDAAQYAALEWMFAGTAGRAVMEYLGPAGCVVDGVRYRHFKRIGVGRTHLTRMETPNGERDGLTDQRRALNRWYCAWALHAMAREYDLDVRIPYLAGIWNTGVPRAVSTDGRRCVSADLDTTVFELCREVLCLDDLYAPADTIAALIATAKRCVMDDLGRSTMTDAEYVIWLARTIGEQCAMLSRLHFDHGQVGGHGAAQLHPNNITLAGEVKDLETGRFVKSPEIAALRYRSGNGHLLPDHVTLDTLPRLERDPSSWLGRLLAVVPAVHFARLANEAFAEQWNVLARLGQHPIALRRVFNHDVWSPFMRAHRDDFQFQL